MISCAVIMMSTVCVYASTSKTSVDARDSVPGFVRGSSLRNFSRLMLERLQALSSTCMYSEHGLLPLIRAVLAQVCQSLIVVSNCMPGSPHSQAACEIARSTSRGVELLDQLAVADGA